MVSFPNKFEERDYKQDKCKGIPIVSEEEKADRKLGIYKLDPDLIKKLITPEELSGIFNLLMIALRRILKNTKIFVNAKTIKERRDKYEIAAKPIQAFIQIATEEDELERSDSTTKEDAYQAYIRFCKDNKLAIGSKENLGKNLIKEYREGREGKAPRRMTWIGMRLTEKYKQQETVDCWTT